MEHLSERGRFALAVRVYQFTGLSAEGHRHYPLRAVKVLRRSPATLLPLCPFLDEWGGVVAQLEESHEVLAALVSGCHKVQGQQGYYRAIAGMRAASSGAFDRAAARMPNAAQRLLRGAELRKLIDVPRVSFESMMRKRTRTALAMFSATHDSPSMIATLDSCSSAPFAAATWRWCVRSGACSARADIRSTSRAADTSTCSSRRSGDRSSRATRRLPSPGGGDCTIAA